MLLDKTKYRQKSTAGASHSKARNALKRLCNLDIAKVYCLHTRDYQHSTPPEGVYCRTLSRKDLEKIVLLRKFEISHRFLMDFSKYQFLGVGVFVDKKLAGLSFYASGELVARHNRGGGIFHGMGVYLPPGAGFMFKVFILPKYRGQRLFETMVNFALLELGVEHTQNLITTAPWNDKSAAKSLERQGFKEHTISAEAVLLGKHFFRPPQPFDPNTCKTLDGKGSVGKAIRFRTPALC